MPGRSSWGRCAGVAAMVNKKWLAAVAAVGVYGCCALWARRQRRRAERRFPPTGDFLAVEGAPIHYARRGEGRPVVLLHGSDGFLQDYATTVLDRMAVEFDAVAFDRPGHGYRDR